MEFDDGMTEKSYINDVLLFIEEHISENPDTLMITNNRYVSMTQLYRDFQNATGHSLKEYVRRRRLSNALALVKHSDMPLIEIAQECGYGSQPAFNKYVKSSLGISPMQYKHSDKYYYFPSYSIDHNRQVSVAYETIPETLCLCYYQSQKYEIEQNAVKRLFEFIPAYNGRIFGRLVYNNLSNKYCYNLYITAWRGYFEQFQNCDGIKESYASCFVSTTTLNEEEDISKAWDYLRADWLIFSMFEQTYTEAFEELIVRKKKIIKRKLYLPIKKRENYFNVAIENISDKIFVKSGTEVTDSLSLNLFNTSLNQYASKYRHDFNFGIKYGEKIYLLDQNSNSQNIFNGGINGTYAVLYGDFHGDYFIYLKQLKSWMKRCGLFTDTESETEGEKSFAVYENVQNNDIDTLRLKLYKKIKLSKERRGPVPHSSLYA